VGVLLLILRAIPALRGLADSIEKALRSTAAQQRREDKLDHIDSAIADALAHPSERVRGDEAGHIEDTDKGTR
jgi:hypothetical protein|tara:strand:- start:1257 stop:1475 length:219 start_codon:yes stop_codon:yes gene_type:complete